MLGKLIKYDFKAQLKMHFGVYIMLLLSMITQTLMVNLKKAYPNSEIIEIFSIFTLVVFVIMIAATLTVTFVYSIVRYRRNLLKDEGYLMHTLPVSAWNLHLSKLITGILWYIADIFVIAAAITVVKGGFKWLRVVSAIGQVVFGMTSAQNFIGYEMSNVQTMEISALPEFSVMAIVFLLIYVLMSAAFSFSQIYACLCIGHTSSLNRDLMSFVAYIITYIIGQILSVIGVIIIGIADFKNAAALFVDDISLASDYMSYMTHIIIFALVISVIMAVIYNMAAVYVTKSKLNLE